MGSLRCLFGDRIASTSNYFVPTWTASSKQDFLAYLQEVGFSKDTQEMAQSNASDIRFVGIRYTHNDMAGVA